jgi:hypothetical protein
MARGVICRSRAGFVPGFRRTAPAFALIVKDQPFELWLWAEVEEEAYFCIRGAKFIQELRFVSSERDDPMPYRLPLWSQCYDRSTSLGE